MTQSLFDSPLAALAVYEPGPELLHSIEAAARMTQVPRRLIALYCRHGLVAPVMDPEASGWFFNDDGIRALRRIEHLRLMCGMNFTAICLIWELLDEVERLQQELRFLRRDERCPPARQSGGPLVFASPNPPGPGPAQPPDIPGFMTPKLLIVTDLGSLKAYELGTSPRGTPRLELLEVIVLADAHQRVVDKVTDLSGRRAATAVGSWGAPLSDAHNLKLETKRRLTKQISQHIRRLVQQHTDGGVWLAAHKGINRLICDSLPAPVRDQIELNFTRDLVNADKSELLATFGPLLTSAKPQPRPRR